ncbi:DUF2905 family protein [Halioxenophilus sp. WMMB6]|uniref:DUF2905 family protein n=1 Tax=Halioxenophilus sp. WMMB6 TaxID=3073815 RepID=UPI00295EF5F0|nr:DUF2905 family protein [Halioxenophilus sp. WMMB6]
MAKLLMILGAVIFVVGVVCYLFPQAFTWFGRLPGDIRIETKTGGLYIPVVSLLLISLVLSLLLNLFRR